MMQIIWNLKKENFYSKSQHAVKKYVTDKGETKLNIYVQLQSIVRVYTYVSWL